MPHMIVKVVTDAPDPDQGDIEAKPKPVPSAKRISDTAAAVNAPPITAGQETPEPDFGRHHDEA